MVIHIPPLISVPLDLSQEGSASWFDAIRVFFSRVFFMAGVPTLSIISGYLLFHGYHATKLSYVSVIAKKAKTLLIPLLVWNIAVLFALYLVQSLGLTDYSFSVKLSSLDFSAFLRAVTAWNGLPINPPTYFLRDLFVCCLLFGLVAWLNKISIWLCLSAVLIAYFAGVLDFILLRPDIMVMFVVGSVLACKQVDLTLLDRYAVGLFALYVALCVLITSFTFLATDKLVAGYFDYCIEALRFLSPFLIWPAAVLLLNSKWRSSLMEKAGMTFFIFNSHGPVLIALYVVWLGLLANNGWSGVWLDIGFYLLAPVLAITVISLVFKLLKARTPRLLSTLTGHRY